MAYFKTGGHDIYFELHGEESAPPVVFINGLTQQTGLWKAHTDYLVERGYRVLLYDMVGQGKSSKPVLYQELDGHPPMLAGLLDHLGIERAYIAGISFGGAIVLKFALSYPERVLGLVPMSTFTEMDARLRWLGAALYEGMAKIGFEFLQNILMPLNVSSRWIEEKEEALPAMKRVGYNSNDLYSIQNLIESLNNFQPFTGSLPEIQAPTLIMNGEWDYLTPRWCHELMRQKIANSRLVLMPHSCHAFTLETPELTCRVLEEFVQSVDSGAWKGDQSVWIANEHFQDGDVLLPCRGDHTRGIPICPEPVKRATAKRGAAK